MSARGGAQVSATLELGTALVSSTLTTALVLLLACAQSLERHAERLVNGATLVDVERERAIQLRGKGEVSRAIARQLGVQQTHPRAIDGDERGRAGGDEEDVERGRLVRGGRDGGGRGGSKGGGGASKGSHVLSAETAPVMNEGWAREGKGQPNPRREVEHKEPTKDDEGRRRLHVRET
jgi:hypothetical protein